MTKDTPTVAVKAMLAVSADLPDEIVYEMTKILFDHVEELHAVHEKAKHISLDTAMDGMSIPVHPGAKKFYTEKGISIPANLQGIISAGFVDYNQNYIAATNKI